MLEKNKTFKIVGIFLKPNSPNLLSTYKKIYSILKKKNIQSLLINYSAKMIGLKGFSLDYICRKSDFLLSIGGDGTLLGVVRKTYLYHKPILGINAGTLGFLAEINIDEIDSFLDNLAIGKYRIDDRMMIEGYIKSTNKKIKFYAFNDIVISRQTISKMINIDAFIDEKWFNNYKGDGLIVSTPTGSTAYNLASGGPIIYPLTKAFIITPISPHSLTQRPLVLPANFKITLKSSNKTKIIIDGQEFYNMDKDSSLIIQVAKIGAKLLHKEEKTYFTVLREKLSWGVSNS